MTRSQESRLAVEVWARISLMPPPKVKAYYRVQDTNGRQGVAFLNQNRTWTPIEGSANPPYDLWSEMR